ncbi:hypothetical protein TH63_09840 [Rufibacter radiotolerans]|uniref:Lipoprotein n=1 Tax=Rufibacter radiotolerans TaxID=1379910 RepID=A0A0H4W611_9BACT|nr:hypothetical protein [Rufibacter radiotolerans]AKQ45876.1 hypothetical protein TH63_09840 [Rufibacter radiotolerans]
MNRTFFLPLLVLLGCGADNAKEEVTALPAKNDSALAEVADSVNNARQDGTDTNAGLPVDKKQQLPAELEVYLDRTHGLWQFPALSDQDLARVPKEEQGPYFLQADFNSDQGQDYAMQIVEKDTAYIYAFLKNKTGDDFEVHLLEKNALITQEGKKRSNRYLMLAKKSGKYYDQVLKKERVIPQDAVSVGKDESLAYYIWEDSKFRKNESGARTSR